MTSALLYGPSFHYIDHLAPLASLLSIPLFTSDGETAEMVREFYPKMELFLEPPSSLPHHAAALSSLFLTSLPRPLFEQIFFLPISFEQKELRSIWVPHGYSDKGNSAPFFEGLSQENYALFYSEKMRQTVAPHIPHLKDFLLTGNYRLPFYLAHKEFYASLIEKKIDAKLEGKGRLFLYAPTWNDAEGSSSFQDAIEPLCSHLPTGDRLIIKLHPNLQIQLPGLIQRIKTQYEENQSILFLDQFPPIYPLLDKVDALLTDRSSIGYDALCFGKPLLFFGKRENDPLHRCGPSLPKKPGKELYSLIDKLLPHDEFDFSEQKKELCAKAFGPPVSLPLLKEELTQFCEKISSSM